jgi:cytochrome c peroxidase
MGLFYGRAGCSSCHSGVFQTDHGFHAIGMPQVGPGFGHGFEGREDFGREEATGDPADRYRFRTPSLRNVVLTGPWGHDGFFNSLEAVVRHHLDPLDPLLNADPSQVVLPPREDLDALDLLEFLQALTDPAAQDLRKSVPTRVPSGLPLAEIK